MICGIMELPWDENWRDTYAFKLRAIGYTYAALLPAELFQKSRLIGKDVTSKLCRIYIRTVTGAALYGTLMAFPMDATCAKRLLRRYVYISAVALTTSRNTFVTNVRNIPPHRFPGNVSFDPLYEIDVGKRPWSRFMAPAMRVKKFVFARISHPRAIAPR